ncbi:MAG: phage tail protein [Methylobacter sp.]|uniref:phage tail protein n=1 Tax=Methylobacter sp. TaxID=2051955 RepID=UPI0025D254E0|nr:phage tail protein [Methylobacter sp.]MCK9622200.1 phage tail protein [Methylobacter sp.]
MGFLFGGQSTSTTAPKLGGLNVQNQGYGVTIPIVIGTNRVPTTLIDYIDFVATPHTTTTSSGKGGGTSSSNTTYTYSAAVILLASEGPILGFGQLWVDKNIYTTPTELGLEEFIGTLPQTPWGYMTTNHPARDESYQGLAYLASGSYALSDNASLGNHSVEIKGVLATSVQPDVNAITCIEEFLTNADWSGLFAASKIGDWTLARTYCTVHDLRISPALTEQKPAHEPIEEWLRIANCGAVWSDGVLKVLPYSRETLATTQILPPEADDLAWSGATNPDNTTLYSDIAFSPTLQMFVAVSFNDNGITRSTDGGQTWSSVDTASFNQDIGNSLRAISWVAAGDTYPGHFIAAGVMGFDLWYVSTDGVSWTEFTGGFNAFELDGLYGIYSTGKFLKHSINSDVTVGTFEVLSDALYDGSDFAFIRMINGDVEISRVLFVGTNTAEGFWYAESADTFATWDEISRPNLEVRWYICNSGVFLAFDGGSKHSEQFIACSETKIYKSNNYGGTTFEQVYAAPAGYLFTGIEYCRYGVAPFTDAVDFTDVVPCHIAVGYYIDGSSNEVSFSVISTDSGDTWSLLPGTDSDYPETVFYSEGGFCSGFYYDAGSSLYIPTIVAVPRANAVDFQRLELAGSAQYITYAPPTETGISLTDEDFIIEGDEDPVRCIPFKDIADAWNRVQVEFKNRDNDYNIEVGEGSSDQANIEAFGLRPMSVVKMHSICRKTVAQFVESTILQRELYIRKHYEFKLSWEHSLLEPMDIVYINDTALGLVDTPVRIIKVVDDEVLTITAEEMPDGSSVGTVYTVSTADSYTPNYTVAVGNVNTPDIFLAPPDLTDSGYEVWMAISNTDANYGGCEVWASFDNASYQRIGTHTRQSIHGDVITANLASSAADPDITNVLHVDLTQCLGELLTVSQLAADSFATLCLVDNEYLSFRDSALTAAYKYDLDHLHRGIYNTTQGASIGDRFVRCDNNLFRYAYDPSLAGETMYLKFIAFNAFGGGLQDIATVTAVPFVLSGQLAIADPELLTGAFAVTQQATPNMTAHILAGSIFDGTDSISIAAQNTGTITAPTTNPRIDRVVISQTDATFLVIAGTEAATPAAPAITAGYFPCAQILLSVGDTAITTAMITDERSGFTLTPVVIPSPAAATALTYSASITADYSVDNSFTLTLTGNTTITFSNGVDGRPIHLRIKQGGAGSYTVTWANVTFGSDITAATLSTAVGDTDLIVVTYNAALSTYMFASIIRGFN